MTHVHDAQSWHAQLRRPAWWNVSGETAPAYACLQVSGYRSDVGGGTILECIKPDGTGTIFAANMGFDIPGDKPGRLTMDWPAPVLADDTGEIGPVDDSWIMEATGNGFHTIGALNAGRALVLGGISSASNAVWFTATLAVTYLPAAGGPVGITPIAAIGSTKNVSAFTSAENPYGCSGAIGDAALCVVDLLDNHKVRLVTVKHKQVKPVIDIRLNTSTQKLEIVVRPMSVMYAGPEEIIAIYDLAEC